MTNREAAMKLAKQYMEIQLKLCEIREELDELSYVDTKVATETFKPNVGARIDALDKKRSELYRESDEIVYKMGYAETCAKYDPVGEYDGD